MQARTGEANDGFKVKVHPLSMLASLVFHMRETQMRPILVLLLVWPQTHRTSPTHITPSWTRPAMLFLVCDRPPVTHQPPTL